MNQRIIVSTEARGLSGYQTPAEIKDAQAIMRVAMAQPHRLGVSPFPADAWMATALGRFCRRHWRDRDTQHGYWQVGERYAQLVDCDSLARGLSPRRCAEAQTSGSELTMVELRERRLDAARHLSDAEDAMREVDNQAPRAVFRLAWEDLDLVATLEGRAYNALYKESVYFERLDRPKTSR